MLADGRINDSRYASSGETMFGIDRKNGGAINTTAAGRRFWSIIDNAGARSSWPWNYMGGSLRQTLKDAAADIMYPEYERMASKYLTPKSKSIVDSDDRLLFNFIYATWNGEGWFRRFSSDFNDAVKSGVINKDQLVQVVLKSRLESSTSLIRQTGAKIASILSNMKQYVVQYAKKNPVTTVLIAAGSAGLMAYWAWLILRKK